MNVCPKCGAEVEGMFCPECGTKIEIEVEETTKVTRDVPQNTIPDNSVQTSVPIPPESPFVKSEPQKKPSSAEGENAGKGMAIASLVFGIISIFTAGGFLFTEVLGIVFAFASKKGRPMRGIAKAGLICSIISIVLLVLIFAIALM